MRNILKHSVFILLMSFHCVCIKAQNISLRHVAKDFTFVFNFNKEFLTEDNGGSKSFIDELEIYSTDSQKIIQTICLSEMTTQPHSVNPLEFADYNGDGKTDFRQPHNQSTKLHTYYLYNSSQKKFLADDLLSQTSDINYDSISKSLTWLKLDSLTKEYILYEYANGKEKKLSQAKMEKLFFEGKKTKNYLLPLSKHLTKIDNVHFVAKVEQTVPIGSPSCACNESIFYYALYKKGTNDWEVYMENAEKNDTGCECQVNYFELENNQVINISPIPVIGEYKLELTSARGIVITSASFYIQ